VRSAIVNVPVRGPPLFAATRNVTVPVPSPSGLDTIAIHSALLCAVHLQPFKAETATLASRVLGGSVCVSGVSVKRHGAASCITRTWLSLTTISPSRIDGTGLGAARNAIVPFPCPDAGKSSEIQLACVETVQAHSG